jgi:ornithine carbamoyltransferase
MNATATTLTLTNDLLTGMEWGPAQVRELFHLAADIKARPDRYRGALEDKFLAMIFEKPSLRTRVTFEVGIASLGGASVFLDHTATRRRTSSAWFTESSREYFRRNRWKALRCTAASR